MIPNGLALVDRALTSAFGRISLASRERMADSLVRWLRHTTRKAPVPDVEDRLNAFEKRIREMCAQLSVHCDGGSFVVKAGSQSDTLVLLRRGSSWFEGDPRIEDVIVAAALDNNRT